MITLEVDGLSFTFEDSLSVGKYDDWAFYRRHFSKIQNGIKAVDLIAVEGETVWLIEVKDYRSQQRTKAIDLADEVAQKVIFTLAAMLPAKVNASVEEERNLAEKVSRVQEIRVVLYLEQPSKKSKLFPHAFDLGNIQLKLKSVIRSIDPHPKVVDMARMQQQRSANLPWLVE